MDADVHGHDHDDQPAIDSRGPRRSMMIKQSTEGASVVRGAASIPGATRGIVADADEVDSTKEELNIWEKIQDNVRKAEVIYNEYPEGEEREDYCPVTEEEQRNWGSALQVTPPEVAGAGAEVKGLQEFQAFQGKRSRGQRENGSTTGRGSVCRAEATGWEPSRSAKDWARDWKNQS